MVSKKIRAVIHNVLATMFGWAAFSFGISSITSPWYYTEPYRVTLWKMCNRTNDNCFSLSEEPWLNATRAFVIIFVIITLFAQMVNITSQRKSNKKTRSSSGWIFTIAATFGVVGAAVATATISQRNVSYQWGIGQIFAWTAVGSDYLAGTFNSISAYYIEESPQTCSTGKTGKCFGTLKL